jgi:hypothetical protein
MKKDELIRLLCCPGFCCIGVSVHRELVGNTLFVTYTHTNWEFGVKIPETGKAEFVSSSTSTEPTYVAMLNSVSINLQRYNNEKNQAYAVKELLKIKEQISDIRSFIYGLQCATERYSYNNYYSSLDEYFALAALKIDLVIKNVENEDLSEST